MTVDELEKLLHTEIPITFAMGVKVKDLSSTMLRLSLPLAPNHNHIGTLYGGSCYSACALACYGLFLSGLQEKGVTSKNVVAGEGHIRYRAPVNQDCVVEASWGLTDSLLEFYENLSRWKKARTEMRAQITIDGKICVEFSAHFIAKL